MKAFCCPGDVQPAYQARSSGSCVMTLATSGELKMLCNGDEHLIEIVSKMAGVKNVSESFISESQYVLTTSFSPTVQGFSHVVVYLSSV